MTPRRFGFFLASFSLALGLFSAMMTLSASAGETGLSYARIVRLSVVKGDVQIARGGTDKWEPAALNMPLQQGFAVGTNDGLAEIELEHGSVIWLAPNSVLQFTELALSNGGQITKVAMTAGTATFDASTGSQDVFSVSDQDFQVAPDGKSEFRVDLTKEGVAVSVLKGRITFQSQQGAQNLSKGDTYFLGVRKPQQTGLKTTPKADDWDKFVSMRASYLSASAATNGQYANAPFRYGMADMSAYGGWMYVPGLGFAWQPNGISSDWMPFADGSMMYYDGMGWTWVGAEPWGWVPYHFGQWSYTSPYGWMWTPGSYNQWAPAPVHWVALGNKVGWTPLAEVKNSAVPAKTPTFVLANRGLNNIYGYKTVTSLKEGQTIQALASSPGASGKLGTTSELRMIVPTARSLSLPGHEISPQVVRAVANTPALSRPPVQAMELSRPIAIQNGMSAARLVTSRPPAQMMIGGFGAMDDIGGRYGDDRSNGLVDSRIAAGNVLAGHAGNANSSTGAKPR